MAGQGGQLVEQIRVTPAGSAGGTALTLAMHGTTVPSAGAIGEDDLGRLLVAMLDHRGVSTEHLVRRAGVQTSASVLPIRPVGSVAVEVVDTTGCGDAFSAGFLRGLELGRSHDDAAVLGSAAAAIVAQGLGSDHGDFDLAGADALAATTATLET